jgi:hypothetical protein
MNHENFLHSVIPAEFFEKAKQIADAHRAEYRGVYFMRHKGGFLGKVLNNPITTILADVAAVATGNPELIPLINAGTSTAGHLVSGDSLGKSLGQGAISGGLAFAGQEIAPVIGNALTDAFPETSAALGITGGANSLTDLFGQTTGGGSLAGVGTIGGDLMGNFAPGSGLESLFGSATPSFGTSLSDEFGTGISPTGSAPSVTSSPGFGGAATSDPGTDFSRFSSASAATAPQSAGAFNPTGAGAPAIGGGSTGGFFSAAPSEGSGSLTDLFARGLSDTGSGSNLLDSFSPPDLSFGGSGGYSIPEQFANAGTANFPSSIYSPTEGFKLGLDGGGSKMTDLKSLFNPVSGLVNNLLRTGITGATTKTNQPGYDLEANAAKDAAANYQPFLDTGTNATKTLTSLFNPANPQSQQQAFDNFRNTPGYSFVRDQGIKALDASAARKGQLVSGNQYKALTDYGSGLADTTFQQYVNNLKGQADQGISAAGGVGTGNIAAAGATAEGKAAANAKRNQISGGLTDALFPANDLLSLIANGGNGGLLSLFM